MFSSILTKNFSLYAPYANDKEFISNDRKLNRTIVDMAFLGTSGYVAGILLSIFFKNKNFIRNFGLGIGLGYGFHFNCKDLLANCANCSKN